MAEKKIKWTQQQKRAITERGSDILVTASAGTGKTTVLSGRCVNILSDRSASADILSMLVLTFTDAAAEQMRRRIGEQLRAAAAESKDRQLWYQLVLLEGADVSTIHSFCRRLITEYFYKLGIDPTFKIIDADEQKLLKAEVLEKTVEWAWQQSNLRAAMEQLLSRRDLRPSGGFLASVIETSNLLDGVISKENWYERAVQLSEAVSAVTSELGQKQKQIVADRLRDIAGQIQYAQKLYEDTRAGGNWAAKWQDSFGQPVSRCLELLEAGQWQRCAEAIIKFEKPARFEYKPRGLEGPIGEVIRGIARKAAGSFEKLSELAILNPDYLDRVGGAASVQTKVLVELVKKFDRSYSEAKGKINCLDFADLEHYALKLLRDENGAEDKLVPSEIAFALRRRYKYIFVDEYQDINAVQKAILELLSSEDNVFVVGDVKQSIYAFRGAKPKIFTEELKRACAEAKKAVNGFRVDLNRNWRSEKGILDFVNKIFGRIMTGGFGDIEYDESAKLRPGLEYEPRGGDRPIVELHILGEQERDNDFENEITGEFASGKDTSGGRFPGDFSRRLNVISGRQRQAAMIARRIREMVGAETGQTEFQIYDKQADRYRDVEYGDIVILMRSPAKRVNDYVEVLRLAGVPVSCELGGGYFEMTEISDILCLLKVLDNPQRDIELAAVLRSPLFGVSDTELAKIKIHSRTEQQDSNFYDSVIRYCASGPDAKLAGRLKTILDRLEQWRTLGRRGNLAELVWQVYRETGFLYYVSALPNGRWRRANLLKLHDRAIQFEGFVSSGGIASLRRFVEFIEELQEAGEDWAPAEPEAEAGNAVRILSVHKSKGLEFPVVFLAELNSRFNKRDIQSELLADEDDTLGLQIIDRQSNSKLSSLAHQVIAEEKMSMSLAEEMRILYVGTTRARQRLILTACEKKNHCRDIISRGLFFGDEPIPGWQLQGCRSSLEWILYGLCDQKSAHEAFETGLGAKAPDDKLFGLKFYGQEDLKELSEYILKLKTDKSKRVRPAKRKKQSKRTGELLPAVKKSLGWRYAFSEETSLAAKQSVTQLTHRSDEYIRIDYSKALERKPKAVLSGKAEEAVDSRLIGTGTHLVIARLELGAPVSREAIENAKAKVLTDGAITQAIAEQIDCDSIMAFFESEPGRKVLDTKNKVWCEWPFTFALPASEWKDSYLLRDTRYEIRDTIIVQGIIDMLVRTPDGVMVIDFKTDRITAEQVGERAELYRRQLELYGRAAGAILKSKILGKWLYFLTPGCAVEI